MKGMKHRLGRLAHRATWWLAVAANVYLLGATIVGTLFSNIDRFYAAVVCLALVWGSVSYLRWAHRTFITSPAAPESTLTFHGDSAAIARLAATLAAEGWGFTQIPDPSESSSQQGDADKRHVITPSGDRKEMWL